MVMSKSKSIPSSKTMVSPDTGNLFAVSNPTKWFMFIVLAG